MSAANTFKITETALEQMRDVIEYLKHRDRDKTKSKKKKDPNQFEEILQAGRLCQQRVSDYYKCRCFGGIDFESRFTMLVRDCILDHDWRLGMRTIRALITEGVNMADTLWKVGLTSLFLENKPKLIEQYVRHLCKISKLNCLEVFQDHLLYLLLLGDLEQADKLIQDYKSITAGVVKKIDPVTDLATPLFMAYQGFVYFMKWKEAISEEEAPMEEEEDFIKTMLTRGTDTRMSKAIAHTAIENMSGVLELIGLWDIFIIKIVEIHTYYGDTDCVRELLKEYSECNLSNINAHRYFYEFEMTTKSEPTEEALECIKRIVKIDPSHPLALELYKHLMKLQDIKAFTVLFEYLDFLHRRYDLQAWEMFETHVTQIIDKVFGSLRRQPRLYPKNHVAAV